MPYFRWQDYRHNYKKIRLNNLKKDYILEVGGIVMSGGSYNKVTIVNADKKLIVVLQRIEINFDHLLRILLFLHNKNPKATTIKKAATVMNK